MVVLYLGDLHTDFHTGFNYLHFLSLSPHSHQHLLYVFLMTVILTRVRWALRVLLICILLADKNDIHFHGFISHKWSFLYGVWTIQARDNMISSNPLDLLGEWNTCTLLCLLSSFWDWYFYLAVNVMGSRDSHSGSLLLPPSTDM